ncbi:hypothetical protein [Paenibacillus sp. NEAU-GSW1]|uniref:hypothetical protein n=1 Tax=Paenibacillus sp. NEAU-GSW1 TaxID=2682486 RepID=UPI0012E1EB91|nr:hypothetical protein [Paenibacillus sp. NEAU-GSW1]MUT64653.1 hypothetical protein [Paenibacillus sp. NEAU-GSW1]
MLVVDQYFGKSAAVENSYLHIYNGAPLDDTDADIMKQIALKREGVTITGKNTVEAFRDGEKSSITFYKIDDGKQIEWLSGDSAQFITTYLDAYNFLVHY